MIGHYSSDQLAILLAAYQVAQEKVDKDLLNVELESWISSLNPEYSHEEIINFLKSQKGTPLEIFFLDDKDLELCSKFIRIAFSEKSHSNRVAIGSCDKIGSGFLLVTNNLKSFFSESYSYGKSVNLSEQTWTYFPNMVTNEFVTDRRNIFKGQAVLNFEEEGIEIRLAWPTEFRDSSSLATSFQKNSRVGEGSTGLTEVGLRVELSGNELRIVSGSPESMIKLMGMLVRNEILTLDSGHDAVKARIALTAVEEDTETVLKTLFIAKESPVGWMGIKTDLPMDWISEQLKLTTSRVLLPHESWTSVVWEKFDI